MANDSTKLNWALGACVAGTEAFVAAFLSLRVTHENGAGDVVTSISQASSTTKTLAVVLFILFAAVTVGLLLWMRSLLYPNAHNSRPSRFADEYADMREKKATKQAAAILADSMPGDTGKGRVGRELVRYAGDLGGKALYSQYEDPETVYAVTRSGKTRSIVTRRVLEAPGPVLATSTKVDALAYTWLPRQRAMGSRTWAFDPMNLAHGPLPVRWNPVVGCEDFNIARERGIAFATASSSETDGGNTGWFVQRGSQILGYFFHAAALAGRDIDSVHRWVSHPEEALEILRAVGTRSSQMMVATLQDLMVDMAAETSSGFKGTMQGALEPIMIPSVLEALTPAYEDSFDAEAFLTSKDVLWVLSPDKEGAVAGVTTMLVDHIENTARRMSNDLPGQRFTPPLSNILDEAAHIAALPNLDSLYAEGPGRGIFTCAVFQDDSQVTKRWGTDTAKVIYQQTRALYVLGGSKDQQWNERIANLTATYEEARVTYTSSQSGSSTSTHTQRRHALLPSDVGKLPIGEAILAPARHDAVVVNLPDIVHDKRWGDEVQESSRVYNEHLAALNALPRSDRAQAREAEAGWMAAGAGDRTEVPAA